MLQDALGIAFCLYMLKTVRLPTFKVLQLDSCVGSVCFSIYFGCKFSRLCPQACTLLLSVLFVYDVFFVFITPFLTNVGGGGVQVGRLPLLPRFAC